MRVRIHVCESLFTSFIPELTLIHAMWIVVYCYVFVLALALSLVLTPIARRIAGRAGMLDLPGGRKPHQRPIPLFGGAAIFTSVAIALLVNSALVFLVSRCAARASLIPSSLAAYLSGARSVFPKLAVILIGGFTIFCIGIWDDVTDLKPRVKLLGQLLVAISLVCLDIRVTLFMPNYYLSAAVTIAWIVVITNAFNLLDNMDGLCAGVALVASAVFLGISTSRGQYFISVMLLVFAGSLLGFLRYNFHPATIFMGDAGSMFIGYFIAVMTVIQTYYSPAEGGPLAVLMPLVILAVPLYDTLSVVAIRISRGESIFTADRRHFSHRLVTLGMSQRGAVCFIYLVTLATGLSALLLPRVGWGGGMIVFAQTILIVSVIAILEYFGRGKR
ncbi:MAG: MraY family glycosyltransferase [Candidatus Aureabacteria bacterium]|nr:MraY family glycosyltransferase [Candidatus Auribacterota bacterium]